MPDIEFNKYTSINNAYSESYIESVNLLGIKDWAVTEKIHGANSQLCWNKEDNKIHYGSRSNFVEENFFNLKAVTEIYEEAIISYCNLKGLDSFIVYGEIFGGNYKHENVEKTLNASKVQKGVYYCPQNYFLAFDIRVNGEYLDVEDFINTCEVLGIQYIPIDIYRGQEIKELLITLKPIMESPSNIHKLFNLPTIEDNIREGVVIKPLHEARTRYGERVIIKYKNDRFTEVSREPREKTVIVLEEEVQVVLDNILPYVTENRLVNVLSHMSPEISIKDFGAVMLAFLDDIYGEFGKDSGELNTLENFQLKILNKELSRPASKIVRKALLSK